MSLIEILLDTSCLERRHSGKPNFYSLLGGGGQTIYNSYPFAAGGNLAEPGGGVWARCRARRILSLIGQEKAETLLDVGAGDGEDLTVFLSNQGLDVVGLEPFEAKALRLSEANVSSICGSVEDLSEFGANRIPNIGMFDSLQYTRSDRITLSTIFKVLKPGGLLFLTVPGGEWLFSSYDHSIGNLRRYSRRALQSQLEAAGFCDVRIEGLFSFLLPLAMIRKLVPRSAALKFAKDGTGVLNLVAPLFDLLCKIEGALPLPWGLSLLGVARKPRQVNGF